MFATLVMEYSTPNQQHASLFYKIVRAVPLLSGRARRVRSKLRWPATPAAAAYMLVLCAHAVDPAALSGGAQLAPIYNPVDQMVPPAFSAAAHRPRVCDRPRCSAPRDPLERMERWQPRPEWRSWSLFLAVQCFFSEFLLSPLSRNWFFAGDRIWSYDARPGNWRYQFWNQSQDALSLRGLGSRFCSLPLGPTRTRLGSLDGAGEAVKRTRARLTFFLTIALVTLGPHRQLPLSSITVTPVRTRSM